MQVERVKLDLLTTELLRVFKTKDLFIQVELVSLYRLLRVMEALAASGGGSVRLQAGMECAADTWLCLWSDEIWSWCCESSIAGSA